VLLMEVLSQHTSRARYHLQHCLTLLLKLLLLLLPLMLICLSHCPQLLL
jgi:hypothetical protein